MRPETDQAKGLGLASPSILFLAFFLLPGSRATAQILAVEPKPEVTRKYKPYLREFQGRMVILGEVKSGLTHSDNFITIHQSNELYLPDSSDPTRIPYRIHKGALVPISKRRILKIPKEHIASVRFFMRDETLIGLREDYTGRMREIDRIKKRRDKNARKSGAWSATHADLISSRTRLCFWLENSLYPKAARKQRKQLNRERKAARDLAAKQRLDDALESIRVVPTPDALLKASEQITRGTVKFRVQESQHLRIVYLTAIPNERIQALLELGETLISDFRTCNADPYMEDGFRDHIPDFIFHEFFFGSSNPRHRERFYTEYYGLKWGLNKEKRLRAAGQFGRLGKRQIHFDYWVWKDLDLQSAIIHRLGHSLTSYHYNLGGQLNLAWMSSPWSEGPRYSICSARSPTRCANRTSPRPGASSTTSRDPKD